VAIYFRNLSELRRLISATNTLWDYDHKRRSIRVKKTDNTK